MVLEATEKNNKSRKQKSVIKINFLGHVFNFMQCHQTVISVLNIELFCSITN